MKKFIAIVGLLLALGVNSQAAVFSTNIPSAALQAYILLSTNVHVYQMQVTASANDPVIVNFYDSKQSTAPAFGTNYTNASFVSKISYASNAVVTENIGATGFTNYLTNVGIYTLLVTNAAATNVLPKLAAIAAGVGQSVVADVDIIAAKGISVLPSTNCSIILYYRPVN